MSLKPQTQGLNFLKIQVHITIVYATFDFFSDAVYVKLWTLKYIYMYMYIRSMFKSLHHNIIFTTGSQDFFFLNSHIEVLVKFWTSRVRPLGIWGLIFFLKIYLYFTMIIHAKYNYITIAGSLKYCSFYIFPLQSMTIFGPNVFLCLHCISLKLHMIIMIKAIYNNIPLFRS